MFLPPSSQGQQVKQLLPAANIFLHPPSLTHLNNHRLPACCVFSPSWLRARCILCLQSFPLILFLLHLWNLAQMSSPVKTYLVPSITCSFLYMHFVHSSLLMSIVLLRNFVSAFPWVLGIHTHVTVLGRVSSIFLLWKFNKKIFSQFG